METANPELHACDSVHYHMGFNMN